MPHCIPVVPNGMCMQNSFNSQWLHIKPHALGMHSFYRASSKRSQTSGIMPQVLEHVIQGHWHAKKTVTTEVYIILLYYYFTFIF